MMLKHSDNMADAETQPRWIAPDALALMRGHPWPGNVRELENVMRRALLLAMDEPQIEAYHIQFDAAVRALPTQPTVPAMPSPAQASMPQSADKNLAQIAFRSEAEAILQALDATGGHRRNAAQQLGISERTLRYRLASMRDNGMTAEPRSVYPASAQ
jgi:two-component system response regulator FlrC